ncbi:MAG: hypothetical protein GQ565_04990 [Candidatus Aegiribacteria sp.]|nr:hypothetical protein [Candidatus Aegiribacteria sp.]
MNKIVVHWKNGEIAKGNTTDFSSARPTFHLKTMDDPLCVEEVKLDILKAVFFVKDFEGNSAHEDAHDFSKAPACGKHIIITFYDGEKFYGTSETIHRDRSGFFIFPIDTDANTIRAFVINSFIESVNLTE